MSILAIIVLIESLVIATLVTWYIALPYIAAYQTAKHIALIKADAERQLETMPPIMRQLATELTTLGRAALSAMSQSRHPSGGAGAAPIQDPTVVIRSDPRIEDHNA